MNKPIEIGRGVTLTPENPVVIIPYSGEKNYEAVIHEILGNLTQNPDIPSDKLFLTRNTAYHKNYEELLESLSEQYNLTIINRPELRHLVYPCIDTPIKNGYIIVNIGIANAAVSYNYVKQTNNYVIHIQGRGLKDKYIDDGLQPAETHVFTPS